MRAFSMCVVFLVVAGVAHAGVYWEHETVLPSPTDFSQSTKSIVRTWHEGQRYKRENPSRHETVIIDVPKGEVYGVSSEKKTFWKMPLDQYRNMAAFSLMVLGVQQKPDGSISVVDPLFVATGQSAQIDRWSAQEMRIAAALPNGVQTSIWVSDKVRLPLAGLAAQLKVSLGNPVGAGYDDLYRQWTELPGYPVQTVTTVKTATATVVSSETLLSFREMKIPLSEFAVPKGYALIEDPITEMQRKSSDALGRMQQKAAEPEPKNQ